MEKIERMFMGRYEHTIDEKGRMTIPARYRELLLNGAYITQGFDRNLMVLTTDYFDVISKRVNQMSITDPDARQLKRLIFSNGDRLESDKAGRVLIPQYLREFAGLEGAAMLVGAGAYFEIWSPRTWAELNEQLADSDTNSQRFTAFDLSTE